MRIRNKKLESSKERLCSKVKKVLEKQKEGYKLSTKAQSTTIPTCQNENINQCVTEITSPQRA